MLVVLGVGWIVAVLRGDFLPAPLLTWGPRLPHTPRKGFKKNIDKLQMGLHWVIGWVDQNALGRILKALVVPFTDLKALSDCQPKACAAGTSKKLKPPKNWLHTKKLNREGNPHRFFIFLAPNSAPLPSATTKARKIKLTQPTPSATPFNPTGHPSLRGS